MALAHSAFLTPSFVSLLILGTFRTPRARRPEGNRPAFAGVGARVICRLEEGGIQSPLQDGSRDTAGRTSCIPPTHPALSQTHYP